MQFFAYNEKAPSPLGTFEKRAAEALVLLEHQLCGDRAEMELVDAYGYLPYEQPKLPNIFKQQLSA